MRPLKRQTTRSENRVKKVYVPERHVDRFYIKTKYQKQPDVYANTGSGKNFERYWK